MSAKINIEQFNAHYILAEKLKDIMNDLSS